MSICPRNKQELIEDFAEAKKYNECIEIRLEELSPLPLDLLQQLLSQHQSCMFTLLDEVQEAISLASLLPQWLSLPFDASKELFLEIKKRWPAVKLIASYHNYEQTEHDLEPVFASCQKMPCDMIKMVTKAISSSDALRMLLFVKKNAHLFPLTAFCMGERGSFSRIIAPIYGSLMTFCSLEKKPTASGQLSIEELLNTYHYHQIDRNTHPFALIGDPIDHSPSHIFYNTLFRKTERNAVYVKIPFSQEEFKEGFSLFEPLGIRGLSVTRPLKACFQPISNTVKYSDGHLTTCNTDGLGMIEAIEKYGSIAEKKVIVLGAGSTAYAIAKRAIEQRAIVVIASRNEEKAKNLAKELSCDWFGWDLSYLLSFPYDVLINATSVGMPGEEDLLPITEACLQENALIADVILSNSTLLLEMARKRGCQIVSGYEMWHCQAAHQLHFWKR